MTLIELMVVVIIVSMLAMIAVPSYLSQIRKSRRTEARTAILDLAGREERFLSTNGAQYSILATDLGYPVAGFPATVGAGYYQVSVCASPANCGVALPAPYFVITAQPAAGSSQLTDAQCQLFSVDSSGRQFASDSGAANQTVACWAN